MGERPDAGEEARSVPDVTFRHRVEYAAVRALTGTLRALPFGFATALARGLARVYALADRRHVAIAERNLTERLGVGPDEARRIARATFRHVFTAAVEMVHFDARIAAVGMDGIVDVKGAEHVERALAAGRGCIWVACHLGNWEIAARVAQARGWPLTSVYRALDNPLLDRWMLAQRLAHGQQMVEKHGALRPLVRALRENRVVVLLVDQDAGRHGVFAPFFGVPASTIPTPAELALRTGAVLVPSFPIRTGPGFRHELTLEPPVPAESTGDREADVLRVTTAINARFEAAVRRTPEQWLWAHRRWKTRPPAADERPGHGPEHGPEHALRGGDRRPASDALPLAGDAGGGAA